MEVEPSNLRNLDEITAEPPVDPAVDELEPDVVVGKHPRDPANNKAGPSNFQNCEPIEAGRLMFDIYILMGEIKSFNKEFERFIKDQKELAKKMLNNVTRYNILHSGLTLNYLPKQTENLLEELIATIQDQAIKIKNSLIVIKKSYHNLPETNKHIQDLSYKMEWNPLINLEARGTINFNNPSEYLEIMSDILYQYDIAITCMFQYYNALKIREKDSFVNLMNSFSISKELSDFVKEVNITFLMLHGAIFQ